MLVVEVPPKRDPDVVVPELVNSEEVIPSIFFSSPCSLLAGSPSFAPVALIAVPDTNPPDNENLPLLSSSLLTVLDLFTLTILIAVKCYTC